MINKLNPIYARAYLDAADEGCPFWKPMLAQKYKNFPPEPPHAIQPKLDGMRCIATAKGLFSRQGKPIKSCPHIWKELTPYFKDDPDIALDGELYNHDLKDDFPKLMSILRKEKCSAEDLKTSAETIQYHIYDHAGGDSEFSYRTKRLHQIIQESECIKLVETTWVYEEDEYDDLHEQFISMGYEGSMLRTNDVYQEKRSNHLLKRKDLICPDQLPASLWKEVWVTGRR